MRVHKTEMKTEEAQVLTEWTCDKCGVDILGLDIMKQQEAHQIEFVGGYESVFGDMNHVTCDLCDKCMHKMIGDICTSRLTW